MRVSEIYGDSQKSTACEVSVAFYECYVAPDSKLLMQPEKQTKWKCSARWKGELGLSPLLEPRPETVWEEKGKALLVVPSTGNGLSQSMAVIKSSASKGLYVVSRRVRMRLL